MSISIADRSWKNISIDFVIDLLESEDTNEKIYNTIMTIICRMSKMRHFISCFADDEDTSIWKTAHLLIRYIWKLHELSKTIISDRDSQFISVLWKAVRNMSIFIIPVVEVAILPSARCTVDFLFSLASRLFQLYASETVIFLCLVRDINRFSMF